MLSLLFVAVVVSPFLYHSLEQRIPFPTDSDQDEYLSESRVIAEQFRFPLARQLYMTWLAAFEKVTGDLRETFFLEKTVSTLLLAFLLAVLGWKLFDARTGFLILIWVLNCKYLLIEPNGSHTLAAAMTVASVLCFYLPWRTAALPASLFILLLSIKVREEMIVPVAFVTGFLVVRALYRWWLGRAASINRMPLNYYYLGAAVVLFAGMIVLFSARPNSSTSPYYSTIMRAEFAGTYVNRTGLRSQLPGKGPWVSEAWNLTYNEKLPGVKTDFDVIRLYPREELANIVYNLKITPRVASAMFLGFDHPLLMMAAFLLYLVSFVVWPGANGVFQRWQPIPTETLTLMVVWALGTCLIAGLICLLYISARHYVQLIPVEIIAMLFLVRFFMSKLLPIIRPSSRAVVFV